MQGVAAPLGASPVGCASTVRVFTHRSLTVEAKLTREKRGLKAEGTPEVRIEPEGMKVSGGGNGLPREPLEAAPGLRVPWVERQHLAKTSLGP